MTNDNQTALKDIAKGSSTILIGEFAGLFLQFACGIIVIRCISKSEYGLFALSINIIDIIVTLSSFGLNDGSPRTISKYNSLKDYNRVWGTIHASLTIVVIISFLLCICLFLLSDLMAVLFNEPDLANVLRTLCFLIPATGFINIMVSVARGFKVTASKLLVDVATSGLRLIAYLFIIYMSLGFKAVLNAQLFAFYASSVLIFVYSFKKLRELIPDAPRINVVRPLMKISLPILGIAILNILATRTAIVFLGYFETSEMVGMYGAARRLVNFMSMPTRTLAFIYLPVATQLYSKNQLQKMQSLYVSVTKWTSLLSLPLAMVLIIDAEFILNLLFGSNYVPAANTLRILGVAFIIPTLVGPNAVTLLTSGKTRTILGVNFIGAILNTLFCLTLIPKYHIIGAAMSIFLSMLISNLILSIVVYKKLNIHPLSKNYIKPVVLTIAVMIPAITLCEYISPSGIILRLVCYFLLSLFTLISPFLTGSIDEEDISVIRSVEQRLFPNRGGFLKKYLSKFGAF